MCRAPDLADAAAVAQARRLLPLDLACGQVRPEHAAHEWLIEHGATEAELDELAAQRRRAGTSWA